MKGMRIVRKQAGGYMSALQLLIKEQIYNIKQV